MERSPRRANVIENILLAGWVLFILCIPPRALQSYKEALIIISPIVIFGGWGISWCKPFRFRSIGALSIGCFLGMTLLTQFFTVDILNGLDSVRSFHLKLVSIVLSLSFLMRRERNRFVLLWAVVGAVFVSTFFGYVDYFLGEDYLPWEKTPSYARGWPHAVFPFGYHKNSFGALFSLYLPLVTGFSFEFSKKGAWFKYAAVMALILASLPVLLFSKSRSGQVGALAGMGIVLLYLLHQNFNRRLLLRVSVIVLLLVGMVYLVFQVPLGEEVARRWRWQDVTDTFHSRYHNIWKPIYRSAGDRFWTGADFSGESFHRYTDFPNHEHNIFLYYFVRSGFLGLLGFSVLIMGGSTALLRRLLSKNSVREGFLCAGVLGSFIGDLVLRGSVEKYPLLFNFGILLAFVFVYSSINPVESKQDRSIRAS